MKNKSVESDIGSVVESMRRAVASWDSFKAELDLVAPIASAHPSKPRRAKRGGKRNGRGEVAAQVLNIAGDFTAQEAAGSTGISTKHARVLLSTLTRRRLLQRVRRGVYRVGKGK